MQRYEHTLTVGAEAIDMLGHVNNVEYVRWIEEVAIRHSAAVGLDMDAYRSMGAAFVIRRHEIDYLRSAHIGDTLTLTTWLKSATRITAARATEIQAADGTTLVRALTTWVFVTLDTARPTRINERVRGAFLPYLEDSTL